MTTENIWNQLQRQSHENTHGNTDNYQKGLKLAEAGQYQEALGYMQEYLRTTPDDPQALNDKRQESHLDQHSYIIFSAPVYKGLFKNILNQLFPGECG